MFLPVLSSVLEDVLFEGGADGGIGGFNFNGTVLL